MSRSWITILLGAALLAACQLGGGKFIGQVSSGGKALDGVEITVIDGSQNIIATSRSNEEGKFVVKASLAPGVYELEARKQGYQNVSRSFSYPDQMTLQLELGKQASVRGYARFPDDSVAPLTKITFKKGKEVVSATTADEGGHFIVKGLDPGNYTIHAIAQQNGIKFVCRVGSFVVDGTKTDLEKDISLKAAKLPVAKPGGQVRRATVPMDVDPPTEN